MSRSRTPSPPSTPSTGRTSPSGTMTFSPPTERKHPLPLPVGMSKYPTPRRKLRNVLFQFTAVFLVLFFVVCPIPLLPSWSGTITGVYESVLGQSEDTVGGRQAHLSSALRPHGGSRPSHLYDLDLPPISGQGEDPPGAPSDAKAEAYVTFLSSISDPRYLESTRLMIYQLLHDPTTADTTRSRDVVVLTTPQIPLDIQRSLEQDGAVVKQVEMLDGFPLPPGLEEGTGHPWKDQYTKLHIFNLTYSRALYLDNDVLLLRSLEGIWTSEGSDVPHGLGGVGERRKEEMVESEQRVEPTEDEPERSYLNAGFMMVRPDPALFRDLTAVRGYNPFYMEQALLNHYFDWDGEHPWTMLDPKFVSHFPKGADIEAGHSALHGKLWRDQYDGSVKAVWTGAVDRMEKHRLGA